MGRLEYDVVVVGGGPAGSSLSILLAELGRSVLLLEKEQMPRDKLCGEFLSPEVAGSTARLGTLGAIENAKAHRITSATCTAPGGTSMEIELPGTAFGLSRRRFDEILFDRARKAGATVRDATAVSEINGGLGSGFEVTTDADTHSGRVVVGAYGRHGKLDRKLGRPSLASRSSLTAFKANFDGVMPDATVELHTFPGGYCGLLPQEEGLINACWIAGADDLKKMGGSPEAQLQVMCATNDLLHARMDGLRQVQPFLAVSNLFFRRKELFAADVCMIGDAAGMIAPLCGDGMAMALQSAEIAAPVIDNFLTGETNESGFRRSYERAWKRRFRSRMAAGRFLHAGLTSRHVSKAGLAVAERLPVLARFVVSATRGS